MLMLNDADLLQLNALADGELDATEAAVLKRRLAQEPDLKAAYDSILATRDVVAALPRPELSPDFLHRLDRAVGIEPAVATPAHSFGAWGDWRQLAASIVLTAFVASGATYMVVGQQSAGAFDDLVASAHQRSLLAASPVDIVTSDRHTVKPYLDAKLGVSPPATDLTAQGFPLVGGRVDVLGREPVPTLVYRHNEHTITLLAKPGDAPSTPAHDFASGGYNMVSWTGTGFSFWAVSDLEPSELDGFVKAYRAAVAP